MYPKKQKPSQKGSNPSQLKQYLKTESSVLVVDTPNSLQPHFYSTFQHTPLLTTPCRENGVRADGGHEVITDAAVAPTPATLLLLLQL